MNVGNIQHPAPRRAARAIILVLWFVPAALLPAATVWNGPTITYQQPAPDPTQATNQDRITPDVWLTRAASKGLFNAVVETNATALSPSNTEWASGTLTNFASLNYTNWLAWLNGASPVTLVGQPVVLHLLPDDIYLSVKFTLWNSGGSGGFAYQRSTPVPFNLSGANLRNGQFTFSYNAEAGFSYVVQNSTNLHDWVPLATNLASGSQVKFTNAFSSAGANFFRLSRWPNP